MDKFLPHQQRQTGRLLLAIGLGLFLGAGAGWAKAPVAEEGEAAEAFGVQGPSFAKALKPVRPTPSEALGIDLGRVPEVRLGAVDVAALLLEDEREARGARTKVVRFGVGRDVQVGARDGHWYDLQTGKRLWVAEVASTDALGVRLHFKDVRLPDGAELAVYAPTATDLSRGIVRSGSPRFDPDRYVELYGSANPIARKGDFWTGTLFSERARIEYLAPAGASDELPFTVDRLQHVYLDPVAQLSKSLAEKAAGPCHNDVACFPEWVDLSKAVSGVGAIGGADSIFCTGQLLNVSGKADFTPYWLTANHCMDNQFQAESVEFYWFFQKATCGGEAPSLSSVPRSQRATLLSTSEQSDYTLLLIEGALPGGLFWAGWTSKEPANGTDAVAIHHPVGSIDQFGSQKRISFGFKDGDLTECRQFFGSNVKMVRTDWTNAVTEGGSSGSGIFRADTGQLYGQLFGGPSACGVPLQDLFDCYGSFASTFTKVKKLLKGGSDDKSEQNDACAKSRVVKAGTLGGRIVKVLDEDWYKVQVKPGQTVVVDLSFADANGDVDLQAFGACGGGTVAVSEGTTDGENVAVTNVGNRPAFLFWRVFLADDTRNNYDMMVHFE